MPLTPRIVRLVREYGRAQWGLGRAPTSTTKLAAAAAEEAVLLAAEAYAMGGPPTDTASAESLLRKRLQALAAENRHLRAKIRSLEKERDRLERREGKMSSTQLATLSSLSRRGLCPVPL